MSGWPRGAPSSRNWTPATWTLSDAIAVMQRYVGGEECQPAGGANPGDTAPAGPTPATTAGEPVPANPPAAAAPAAPKQ